MNHNIRKLLSVSIKNALASVRGSPVHREEMLGTRSYRSNGWIRKRVPFVPLLTIETKTLDVLGLNSYIFFDPHPRISPSPLQARKNQG